MVVVIVTHQAKKNLDLQLYDCSTIQGATFNMHGQLYRGHANTTALSSSPVVSALGSESDDLGSTPGQGKAKCPWDVQGKKNASSAFRLGKIYILLKSNNGCLLLCWSLFLIVVASICCIHIVVAVFKICETNILLTTSTT